jgi:hypothetical protein
LNTVRRFIYTKYWEILYVEHCGNIYLHKILGITLCWTLWEDVFTQNTEEYCMLSTIGRFIYNKYWGLLHLEHYGKIYLHKILDITLCSTLWEDYLHKIVGNTLFWTLWEDLFTWNSGKYFILNTGKIYLHKILRNTLCWTLWQYLFTQNTEELLYVEHCGKIYLQKILGITLCWTLWEDLFTQNTEE